MRTVKKVNIDLSSLQEEFDGMLEVFGNNKEVSKRYNLRKLNTIIADIKNPNQSYLLRLLLSHINKTDLIRKLEELKILYNI